MDADSLIRMLQDRLPGVSVEAAPTVDLQTTVYIGARDVVTVLQILRDDPQLQFEFLAEITAADYWPREPRFEVIYILVSIAHRYRLRVKVRLQGEAAVVPDISALWPAANWLEREVWDLFGIEFDGHPDPRRLLMPEDWEGHPLRKDYPVQVKLAARTTEPTQVTEEEFRANLMKDRLARGSPVR